MSRSIRLTAAELERLQDEAGVLRERLARVTLALSLTEDVIATTFDDLADQGGPNATERRLVAKRARSAADACRALLTHLDEIDGSWRVETSRAERD